MGIVDSIVEASTAFLVRTILRPKVYVEEDLSLKEITKEPSIFVVNHTGHLDGPILNTVFRHVKIHSLAAKDRFSQKGFGFFLRHTGCIPIDRENPDISWVHTAVSTLKIRKEFIAIYPEGRHGKHREQLPFHSGVTMLASISNVPIIMVYMDGPYKAFGGKRAKLLVSKPFRMDSSSMNSDNVNAQTALLQERMKGLMADFIELEDRLS